MESDASTDGPTRVHHPVFARVYARFFAPQIAQLGGSGIRRRLLAGLTGQVVEVGPGPGDTFAEYPGSVDRLIAVEPESYLRERAAAVAARLQNAAASAAHPVIDVIGGSADRLPLADDSVDAVVFSLVLCSVPDQATALAEARRVLRPGGEVRVFEHIAAPDGTMMRRIQRVLDATFWPPMSGGCRTGRDTVTALADAGFDVSAIEPVVLPGFRGPASTIVLGSAR